MKHTPKFTAENMGFEGWTIFYTYPLYEDVRIRVLANGLSEELAQFIVKACNEYEWMRREIERVGDALFTNTEGQYTGTEEDLQAIGQFVEGVVETMLELKDENERLTEALAKAEQE